MSETVRVELVPLGVSLEVRRGAALGSVLAAHGLEFPCGGSELCGGCRVRLLEGTLTPTPKDKLALTDEEIAAGWRLACQAHAETALKLHVEQWTVPILGDHTRLRGSARSGLGIAVDVGTTTLVAQMVDLTTGDLLGVRTRTESANRVWRRHHDAVALRPDETGFNLSDSRCHRRDGQPACGGP